MTNLGRYMRDTGTSHAWLAEMIGVNRSSVWQWCHGRKGMRPGTGKRILEVLAARADVELAGLLSDQKPYSPGGPVRVGGTPYDQMVR